MDWSGAVDRDQLMLQLTQGLSVEKIAARTGRHPSTIAYWMAKHGLVAPAREKHAAKGGIERELLEGLVGQGLTVAEIAASVAMSTATVRHWLRRYGLRTAGARRLAEMRAARDVGAPTVMRTCARHGEVQFVLEGRGYYRCRQCRLERVARQRRALKATLVAEAGGCCQICGYDRCVAALEFHHVDPSEKRLGISAGGLSLGIETLRAETAKCVLLCSNCHAEVESGVRPLPLK